MHVWLYDVSCFNSSLKLVHAIVIIPIYLVYCSFRFLITLASPLIVILLHQWSTYPPDQGRVCRIYLWEEIADIPLVNPLPPLAYHLPQRVSMTGGHSPTIHWGLQQLGFDPFVCLQKFLFVMHIFFLHSLTFFFLMFVQPENIDISSSHSWPHISRLWFQVILSL